MFFNFTFCLFHIVEDSNINKECLGHEATNQGQHVQNNTLLQEQNKPTQEITIQVYPNSQAISLVTTSILSADVTSFPTQVPTFLTEGDAEASETHYQVVTTSSMLNHGDGSTAALDVLTSSADLTRNVILTDQQQVLLSGMLVPGVTGNQAIHINMTRDGSSGMEVDETSQDEQVFELRPVISRSNTIFQMHTRIFKTVSNVSATLGWSVSTLYL